MVKQPSSASFLFQQKFQVTAQICSFRLRLLLKSVLFTPGYCSNVFFVSTFSKILQTSHHVASVTTTQNQELFLETTPWVMDDNSVQNCQQCSFVQ